MYAFFHNSVSNPAFRHTLIFIGLIVFALVVQRAEIKLADSKAEDWAKKIKIESTTKSSLFSPAFIATDAEKGRLAQQVETIRGRAEHHFTVMKYFYSRYYMSIVEMLIFGIPAAVALLFITKDGWNDTNNQYVKTVFLTATAITAFFAAFPPVFQQNQNIADNKKLYLQYVALHDEVMSYLTLQQNINGEPKTASEFIHYLDKQLIQLNTFAIGFDDSKVPNYKNVFNVK